jgi:hypothetical protein
MITAFYLERKYADFFILMRKDSNEMRYKKSMGRGIDTRAVTGRIKELMEFENIYLDEKLSLQRLSEILNIKPYQITEILNSELKINFRSLLNSYRVAAVKKIRPDFEIGTTNLK